MAFSAQILINSIDYYAQLTDELSVSIDEGAARIATFTLDPLPGSIDPYAWLGQPVSIYFIDGTTDLLFTGTVHSADYDIDAGTTRFTCSDLLQEAFETVSRGAADALITQGIWNSKIFRNTRDNWDYAQQKMSTYPGSLDKSPSGILRITPWAAKATPDLTYTDASIDSGTLRIEQLSMRRNIINSIKINYTSVFQALRQREQSVTWDAVYPSPGNWYQYLERPFALPERTAIESALNDWTIKSISYVDLPDTGWFSYLGSDILWYLNDYGRALCQGFDAVVATRWRQDVAINYEITVSNAASIAEHGLLEIEQNVTVSHKKPGRDDDFLKFDTYKTPEGTQVLASSDQNEWLNATQGDDSLPQLTAMSIAKTRILDSHRQNRISFDCALNADLDTEKTVYINHVKLQAKGKVTRIQHRVNVIDGFATTKCTIAVTLPIVSGQTDDAIIRGQTPYITAAPSIIPPGTPAAFPALSQYIGRDAFLDPDDPTWNGWITNYDFYAGFEPSVVYDPIRFAVETASLDPTDYNAWLNDTYELQTKLIKSGGSYYQRIYLSGETPVIGDSIQLYNVDAAVGSPIILNSGDLAAGYVQVAADESRQDEHSITYEVDSSFNVALPVDVLSISK